MFSVGVLFSYIPVNHTLMLNSFSCKKNINKAREGVYIEIFVFSLANNETLNLHLLLS